MYVITQPEVVLRQLADFEKTWSQAMPLTDEVLEKITEEYLFRMEENEEKEKQKAEEKAERRSRSKSQPREVLSRPLRAIGDIDTATVGEEPTEDE